MSESISATISTIETAPYSADELARLPFYRVSQIHEEGYRKPVKEEIIEQLADSLDGIRQKVLSLYERSHPTPLVVKTTPPLSDKFVMGGRYDAHDTNAIREVILYEVAPGGSDSSLKEKTAISRDMMLRHITRVRQSLNGGRDLTPEERKNADAFESQLMGQGKNPFPELNRQLAEIGAILFSSSPLSRDLLSVKRTIEDLAATSSSREPHATADLSRPIYFGRRDRLKILGRIIGRNADRVHEFCTYFRELYNIGPPYYSANNAPVQVNYEKVVPQTRPDEKGSV